MRLPTLTTAALAVCTCSLGVAGLVALPTAPAAVALPRAIGNPVAGNQGFGTIVEQDAELGSTETEATVALGGDLSWGPGYNVALHNTGTFIDDGDAQPTALLVGGRVLPESSEGVLNVLNSGYVKIGDPTGIDVRDTDDNNAAGNTRVVAQGAGWDSQPRIQLTTMQPVDSVAPKPGLIDFPSLFTTYRERAAEMDTCAANVVLTDANGTPLDPQTGLPPGTNAHVRLTPGTTNVLHITGQDLNNLDNLTFDNQPTADTPFLVVVDTTASGGVYTWDSVTTAGIAGAQAPYILWDFPDATTIEQATGDSIEGTFYAPNADFIDTDPANVEGGIVVRELHHGPQAAPAVWTRSDKPTRPSDR